MNHTEPDNVNFDTTAMMGRAILISLVILAISATIIFS